MKNLARKSISFTFLKRPTLLYSISITLIIEYHPPSIQVMQVNESYFCPLKKGNSKLRLSTERINKNEPVGTKKPETNTVPLLILQQPPAKPKALSLTQI